MLGVKIKKLLPLMLLLVSSCEEITEAIIEGCTTTTACNYDATAMKDDGSCVAPQGCNEWCVGDTLSVQELDCAGDCNGTATIDLCGNCSNNNIPCVQDCMGEWGGSAEIGECGLCINSYITCPGEDGCYNVGYDDLCPMNGCCPHPYVKDCSCNGRCVRVERLNDGGCDEPGVGGGHDGADLRCYFNDGGDCE